MSHWIPGRPGPGEFAPWASAYVAAVEGDDIMLTLAAQGAALVDLYLKLDPNRSASFRPAPGKWTANEILGHIIDAERVFSYRALSFARGEAKPLPGFEQDDYVAAARANETPVSALIDEFRAVRSSTLMLFRNLPQDAWLTSGTANGHPHTARGMAFVAAGHAQSHYRILAEKYL